MSADETGAQLLGDRRRATGPGWKSTGRLQRRLWDGGTKLFDGSLAESSVVIDGARGRGLAVWVWREAAGWRAGGRRSGAAGASASDAADSLCHKCAH